MGGKCNKGGDQVVEGTGGKKDRWQRGTDGRRDRWQGWVGMVNLVGLKVV